MTWSRFGVYVLPDPEADTWARKATDWLGWDATRGLVRAQPEVAGLDLARVTATPRRYGLHATLKPPFRLVADKTEDALLAACDQLARRQPRVCLTGLRLTRMGRFLALTAAPPSDGIDNLAAACVTTLDPFRAPPTADDLARRRATGLSPAEEANLTRWGYPYVMDRFRFHITLTGRMTPPEADVAARALGALLSDDLPARLSVNTIALVGEDGQGRFHLIRRFDLTG